MRFAALWKKMKAIFSAKPFQPPYEIEHLNREFTHPAYVLGESRKHPGQWRVERQMANGSWEGVVFTGSDAQRRATVFATTLNQEQGAQA